MARRSNVQPVFVRLETAAMLLDMIPKELADLVHHGALPGPRKIGAHQRWSVEQIKAIVDGTAARPEDEFDL